MWDRLVSAYRSTSAWAIKYWAEIIPPLYFGLLVAAIATLYHFSLLEKIIAEFIAVAVAFYFTLNILHNLRNIKLRPLINADKLLLKQAYDHGDVAYLFETNILVRKHRLLNEEMRKLRDAKQQMSLFEYRDLLLDFVSALEKSNITRIEIAGTCLILPQNFSTDDAYVKLWEEVCQKLNEYECNFIRILCDHQTSNLISAIEANRDKFASFCKWNKNTGFKLYIYRDSYDDLRKHNRLEFNDFLIYNDSIVIGGEVQEEEKCKVAVKLSHDIKVGIDYADVEQYKKLLMSIIHECKLVDLQLSDHLIIESVLEFLKVGTK